MRGRGLFHAVELDQHDALLDAFLIGLGGGATGEKAAAVSADGRSGELGVFGQRIRVRNRKISRDPISFCHHGLPQSYRCTAKHSLSGSAWPRRGAKTVEMSGRAP